MDDPTVNKVFNDSVHGHIQLHPLLVRIIDTPQFQRLRYIKQNGAAYYVFPGASYNRFEHSLGVCHLAGELLSQIHKRQEELEITSKDILCVQIAGLCHDLGHGPFSHMFDAIFMKKMWPDKHWKHEMGSKKMFRHMIEVNEDLQKMLVTYEINEVDLLFIEELIYPEYKINDEWSFKGRTKEKSFLYEVVANKRTGIDVDKWDYFARDCHHFGMTSNFDHTRFMKFAKVIKVDGIRQICTRDKEVGDLYDMFHMRTTLHRRACRHKTKDLIEFMISDALEKADPYIKIPSKNGEYCKISECYDNMEAFTRLTDYIYLQILHSTESDLKDAREILERIQRRDLYAFIGESQPENPETSIDENGLSEADIAGDLHDTIVIDVVKIDYGKKKDNPVDYMRFYTKHNPTVAVPISKEELLTNMLPGHFCDQIIRVYSRKTDTPTCRQVLISFAKWCKDNNMKEPQNGLSYLSKT